MLSHLNVKAKLTYKHQLEELIIEHHILSATKSLFRESRD